jgi:flagellar motor switch/type III secretory pathway protein FliN
VSPKLNSTKKSALKNATGEHKISLHYYFDWYEKTFCEKLTNAGSEFLASDVEFKLVGISDSPCQIWQDCDYFVTQVKVSKEHAITIKVSDTAANLVFRNALGDRPKETGYLKLKDITELEAKILTAFNEFLYKKISGNFLTPKEIKSIEYEVNSEEKTIYLTFYICGNTDDEAGKIIFIFPQFVMRSIAPVNKPELPLDLDYFKPCLVETDIIAGYSRITLDDVKNLDLEDIVILENSHLYSMILKNHENLRININPDPNIVIDLDEDNGDDAVSKVTGNIWDSLEVDLSAEFEKVKIRLGDLRHVIEGLVIDVAPIAQNKLFLNVEGKQVAAGELVIVGDKYGVKITEVYNDAKAVKHEPAVAMASQSTENTRQHENHENAHAEQHSGDINNEQEEIDDSDFDFSDYEIEEDV